MNLSDDSPYAIGVRSDGSPQLLYELEDGTSGFLAHELEVGRLVEIHRLPIPNAIWQKHYDSILERLAQAEKLRHPHLAGILGIGESPDGHCFYVTEFVEGERLRIWLERVIEEFGAIPRRLGLGLTLQLADLIAYLANWPRLLSSVNLDDFAVSLDRGHFLQLRLTDFGFDREENPIRDTELASRWIQSTALLLQHLLDGKPLPDPESLLEAATQPMVEGPLRSLITDLHERAGSIAFAELTTLKTSLVRAVGQADRTNRQHRPEFRGVPAPALVPRGPLYALMRESPELGELADGRWQTLEEPGPDGHSPFSLRAVAISAGENGSGSEIRKVDLEFLPPERLVDRGIVSFLTDKMQHPYLRKHPNLIRSRSIHAETDFSLVANEATNGFSLMSLVARRGSLSPSDACHLARQLDRLLIHLDDATRIQYGGLDPWRVLIHFNADLTEEEVDRLLTEIPAASWAAAEWKLRVESVTDSIVEPARSSWRYLHEVRMNGKPLAALSLWMLESARFDQLLAENRADSQPLTLDPGLDELFRNAAAYLDERDPAQRTRFLQMFESRTANLKPREPESEEPGARPVREPKKQRRSGLFRRQRTMTSRG